MAEKVSTAPGASPPAPTGQGLAAADRALLQRLDEAFLEAARRAGEQLACRPGCFECCRGPFPITQLDAWRLRKEMENLRSKDPQRAETIRRRAREAWALLRAGFPGDPSAGRLSEEPEEDEAYYASHDALLCPALDPQSGLCDLYAARPVSCRTYGPPVRIGSDLAPSCRLCFTDAAPAQIERCRVEPDPDRLEEAILARFHREIGEDRETFVAFALTEEGR